MKRLWVLLSLLLLLPTIVLAQETKMDPPHITVSGVGEIKVRPDIARLTLGVETTDKDSARASELNAAKANAVVRVLKALGIAEDDIQTTNYAVEPKYSEEKTPRLIGYTVRNTLLATVRKITDTGRVMDAAIKAGANISEGIVFDLNAADKAKAEEDALINAIDDGERKAKVIARRIRVNNWYLYSVSEEINTVGPEDRMRNAGMNGFIAETRASTPISTGNLTIRATVSLQYNYLAADLPRPQ